MYEEHSEEERPGGLWILGGCHEHLVSVHDDLCK